LRAIDLARRMVDTGSALAVMGNHELNAIAWHTPDAKRRGDYLRTHYDPRRGAKNRAQHAAFLAEVEGQPALHAEIIDWFLTLPLWLDLPGLRVVHACWHPAFMAWLAPHLEGGRHLTRELMVEATDEPAEVAEKDNASPSVFKAVECLTKGIEIPLPGGWQFQDKDGHLRDRVRVRWWDERATSYRKAAILSPEECAAVADGPIPAHARVATADGGPVFFGHYWLTGAPVLQSRRHACVDYSAGNGGPLVAYRINGEPTLSPEGFVWVN
jgi:hypothetical protein